MLDSKLPELQEIIATPKAAVADRLMVLEDELGEIMANVGSGEDVPGGPYVNIWSEVGTALENNQAEKLRNKSRPPWGNWKKWSLSPTARPRRKANFEPKF
jgi:hypothetical protein